MKIIPIDNIRESCMFYQKSLIIFERREKILNNNQFNFIIRILLNFRKTCVSYIRKYMLAIAYLIRQLYIDNINILNMNVALETLIMSP